MVLDEKYVSGEKESENLNLGAGIEFLFTNLSEKKIKDFTIVLFAFDEEGNSPFYNRNNLVFKFDEEVDSKESFLGEVGISDYMDVIPEEVYELEYIYVSQIEYDDGFVWRDSFGTESLVKDELPLK